MQSGILIATITMATFAITLLVIGYRRGAAEHILGLKCAIRMLSKIAPMLILSFVVTGLVQILVPGEMVSKWIGAESGLRGILFGTLAGGFVPGGPYICLPIAAGLFHAGAEIGTLVAFMTAWSMLGFFRLPQEIGILGWRVTLIRFGCSLLFPPIGGLLASILFSNISLS